MTASRTLARFARLVALIALLPALARAQSTVAGVVRDATSATSLVGAIVTLGRGTDQRTTRTDGNGAFLFSNVSRGSYPIAVRRFGYEPSQIDVDIPHDGPVVVTLRRAASLDTVRVHAADQGIYGVVGTARDLKPLNASIQVLGAGVSQARTDSAGRFFVSVETPGPYLVRATADGFTGQTVSVVVKPNEGVDVSLLLDWAFGPADHTLDMAFDDFADRMMQRGLASALVPRTDLTRYGDSGTLASSLVSGRSLGSHGLRLSSTACVFVDGQPVPGISMNAYGPDEIEMVEAYGPQADRARNLAQRWPRGAPCGDTGVIGVPAGDDVVQWVVIWLKH